MSLLGTIKALLLGHGDQVDLAMRHLRDSASSHAQQAANTIRGAHATALIPHVETIEALRHSTDHLLEVTNGQVLAGLMAQQQERRQ